MRVKEAMHTGATWCTPDTPLVDVARIMRDEDIGCLPIGENDRLVGMVTDRDLAVRAVAEGKDCTTCTAGDVMSTGILYVREDDDLEEAVRFLESKQIRRAPVINANKRLVGMLSVGDVSEVGTQEQKAELVEAVTAHHA